MFILFLFLSLIDLTSLQQKFLKARRLHQSTLVSLSSSVPAECLWNPLWCFLLVVKPGGGGSNCAPPLFSHVCLGDSLSRSTPPGTACPRVSLVPGQCIEEVQSQCCHVFWNSNPTFPVKRTSYFTVLYEHTIISIVTRGGMMCILDGPILFCVFHVFQEMRGETPIERNGVNFSDFWEK